MIWFDEHLHRFIQHVGGTDRDWPTVVALSAIV